MSSKQSVFVTITRTAGSAVPLTGDAEDDGSSYEITCGGKQLMIANFPSQVGTVQALFRRAVEAADPASTTQTWRLGEAERRDPTKRLLYEMFVAAEQVAFNSFTHGSDGGYVFNDDTWREEHPEGARLAIEVREHLGLSPFVYDSPELPGLVGREE